jgi:hypothetical protein
MRFSLLYFFLLFTASSSLWGQKILVLERANRVRTTKLYQGELLRFRLAGKENYWYERTITDILPETKTLLLDNFAVQLDSIVAIKVNRRSIWRITGGALISLGATLTLATTAGKYFYNDDGVDAPKLYGIAAVSLGTGLFLNTTRKLKLGKKHRLRIIEIKFPDPMVPPPPMKQ